MAEVVPVEALLVQITEQDQQLKEMDQKAQD